MKLTKKKARWPSKTSLNLAMRERSLASPSRLIPVILAFLLALAAFSKFAVADRLNRVKQAEQEVAAVQAQIAALDAQTAGYNALLEEYSRQSSGWMADTERALIDRRTVFSLLDTAVLPSAQLRGFQISENSLSLNLTGLSLSDASTIVSRLQAREDVVDVSVSTADKTTLAAADGAAEATQTPTIGLSNTRTGSATINITLTNGTPLPSDEEAAAATEEAQ